MNLQSDSAFSDDLSQISKLQQTTARSVIDLSTSDPAQGARLIGGYGDQLGQSVAVLGDFNGDGFDDIGLVNLRGGYINSEPVLAYVVFGAGDFGDVEDISAVGPNAAIAFTTPDRDARYGASIIAAGDFDGDGLDDAVIGAPDLNGPGALLDVIDTGAAFFLFGDASAPLEGDAVARLRGDAKRDEFGVAVAASGDFNGDGLPDVFVANTGSYSGNDTISVILGGARLDGDGRVGDLASDARIEISPGDDALEGLGGAGDFNGDGLSDVIVRTSGPLKIVFGETEPPAAIDAGDIGVSHGVAVDGVGYGIRVAAVGDVNGDGFDDIVISDPTIRSDVTSSYDGAAFVLLGSDEEGPVTIDWRAPAPDQGFWIRGADGQYLGREVAAAGDVNGDGLDDFLIHAARAADDSNINPVYVVYGTETVADLVASEMTAADGFEIALPADDTPRVSLGGGGDVNGDGFDDIVLGLPKFDNSSEYSQYSTWVTGAAFVVFGFASDIESALNASDDDYVADVGVATRVRIGAAREATDILSNDVGASGALTITAVGGGVAGEWIRGSNGGEFRISPNGAVDFRNLDDDAQAGETTRVSYTVEDDAGASSTASINVRLIEAPSAIADTYEVEASDLGGRIRIGAAREGTDVLANDIDPTGGGLTIVAVGYEGAGDWVMGDGGGEFRISGNGAVDFRDLDGDLAEGGSTSTSYRISDADGLVSDGLITVTVDDLIA